MGAKGDETKRKILETACDLFYLRGYHGTSIDDILKACRVKKGNLYFHFKSKEALGLSVIDMYGSVMIPFFQETLRGKGSALSRLFGLFQAQERRLKSARFKGGCPLGNLALELADHHDGFRRKLDAIFDAWAREVEQLLKEAQKEGEIKKSVDPKQMATFVVAVLEGGILLAKTKKSGQVYRHCMKSLECLIRGPGIR
ncbi:MAG: TetR family transcriptional regulator C-terminal domain-containing protein [Nitrospirae bacterium]|nr:TetR family transcriptional regulator C-terminal domain-containing protein [Candidatus Manganitrophaceae bacterium]